MLILTAVLRFVNMFVLDKAVVVAIMRDRPVCLDTLIQALTPACKAHSIYYCIQLINTSLLCDYKCASVNTGSVQELTAVERGSCVYGILHSYRLCHIQQLILYRELLLQYI